MPHVSFDRESKLVELLRGIDAAAAEARALLSDGAADKTALARLAREFCTLDDDGQAQFFVEVAKIMRAWPSANGLEIQAQAVGSHLRTCECSTADAREFVAHLAYAVEQGEHK